MVFSVLEYYSNSDQPHETLESSFDTCDHSRYFICKLQTRIWYLSVTYIFY